MTEPMTVGKWFRDNAQGLIDLMDSLDPDDDVCASNPGFAAQRRAWKRDRAEQKRRLEGAARRLAR